MATSSNPVDREEKAVLDDLKQLHPNRNDRLIMEKVYDQILEIKSGANSDIELAFDGFIYCWIVIESAFSSSNKCRFRVKIEWTGLDTKQEVNRLYEIPVRYQNLIINENVVSDEQTLAEFEFKRTGQIVYVFLSKNKINYVESNIRISDVIAPREDVHMADGAGGDSRETIPHQVCSAMEIDDTDGSSDNTTTDAPSTGQSGPRKHRGGKKRSRGNKKR